MKRLVSSLLLAGLVVTSSFAADVKTEKVSHNAVINAETKAQTDNSLVKEAVLALQYTNDAYIYLNQNDKEKALSSLKKAIGELTIVLNTPNAPYLLPVNVNVVAEEYIGTIDNISKQLTAAKVALSANKIPLAREILNSLKSEIDIQTINIPLATYPAAIKLAVKYINEGKVKNAKDVIAMALNTLVNVNTVIPIPILKAQELIKAASKAKKEQALKYLEEAKRQLKIAQLLGYTSKSDTTYAMLKKEIEKIEDKIKNNKNTKSIFEDLKQKIEEFKEKAVSIFHK